MRVKIGIRILPFLLAPFLVFGQSDPGIYSARSFGLAGINTVLDGVDAIYGNGALLTSVPGVSLHAGSAQSFGSSPLVQANAGIALPVHAGNILFARIGQFGFSSYQERLIGLGYAMRLIDQLSVAARFDVYQFGIDGYGTTFLPGFSLGMQYSAGRHLVIGINATNPVSLSSHDAIELPVTLSAGIAYHPTEDVGVFAEIEKDIEFSPRIKFAVEYQIGHVLILRTGLRSNPGTFHAGMGLLLRSAFRIDIGVGYHQQLGFTPAIGFSFSEPNSRR